jgi:hypothetical protein
MKTVKHKIIFVVKINITKFKTFLFSQRTYKLLLLSKKSKASIKHSHPAGIKIISYIFKSDGNIVDVPGLHTILSHTHNTCIHFGSTYIYIL